MAHSQESRGMSIWCEQWKEGPNRCRHKPAAGEPGQGRSLVLILLRWKAGVEHSPKLVRDSLICLCLIGSPLFSVSFKDKNKQTSWVCGQLHKQCSLEVCKEYVGCIYICAWMLSVSLLCAWSHSLIWGRFLSNAGKWSLFDDLRGLKSQNTGTFIISCLRCYGYIRTMTVSDST